MNLKAILAAVGSFGLIRCCQDRKAAISLTVGLLAPLLVAAVAFAVDAGLWISQHTALQTATDAAAMKGARDLSANPTITSAALTSDALAAATAAAPNILKTVVDSTTGNTALAANGNQTFNVTQPTATEVKVNASISGDIFFSRVLSLFPGAQAAFSVTIGASSTAGVPTTCYSLDSYSYLFSTGIGAIDTAHSSGIDSYSCGSSLPSPPSAYVASGGILGTNLGPLKISGVTGLLLPFAIAIGPSPASPVSGLNGILAPVLQTVTNIASLVIGDGTAGSMTCSNNTCTVTAGVFSGGLTLPGTPSSPVTINFVPDYFNNDTFQIKNGDLIIPSQDTVSSNNAIFYFDGTTPGGLVETTQVQANTVFINTGAIVLKSKTTFTDNSIAGTQTSSPISAYSYTESAETQKGLLPSVSLNGNNGLLSFLNMPAGDVLGTNFFSTLATCPQATSSCPGTVRIAPTSPVYQNTLLPPISGILGYLTTLGLQNVPVVSLLFSSSPGETSVTNFTSAIAFANNVPTDWFQEEEFSSSSTPFLAGVTDVANYLGLPGLSLGLSVTFNTVLSLLSLLGLQSPYNINQPAYSNSGTFQTQNSSATPSATSCSSQTILFNNSGQPYTSKFNVSFSDVLDSGGTNGAFGAMTMSDTLAICGTTGPGVYLMQ